MADTNFGVNHPLAVKVWTRKLLHEALRQTWAYKFMGKTSNDLIHIYDELTKGPGDTVYPMLRMQLTGDGVQGDDTLEGSEEELQTARDAVVLDQLRNAVRSKGRASEQRVPFSMRHEAYMGLADWYSARNDAAFMNQIGGNTGQTDTKFTGNNATVAPSTNNHLIIDVDATTEASLSTSASSAFTLTAIDRAVVRAKTKVNTPIRPIMVNGEEKYAMFIHPFQHHQLRSNTATGQYIDIQKAAMQGGQIRQNPLYTGAIGEYNGVVLHESNRVPRSWASPSRDQSHTDLTTTIAPQDVTRAILCGAEAMTMTFGNNQSQDSPTWFEELFDYGNKLGVAAGLIFGMKKSQYTISGTAEDFGTIVVSTYSPDPS